MYKIGTKNIMSKMTAKQIFINLSILTIAVAESKVNVVNNATKKIPRKIHKFELIFIICLCKKWCQNLCQSLEIRPSKFFQQHSWIFAKCKFCSSWFANILLQSQQIFSGRIFLSITGFSLNFGFSFLGYFDSSSPQMPQLFLCLKVSLRKKLKLGSRVSSLKMKVDWNCVSLFI